MHETLFKYIEIKSGEKLTEAEQDAITVAFNRKRMRKRQYFLQEGDICKYVGFITKGSARMFSVDEKGNEHIMRFGLEDWWMSDQESFINLTPSPYYIEMLEDSELLIITYAGLLELRRKSPCFDIMLDVIYRFQTIAIQKRIRAAIGMSAEEKYHDLMHSYPQFTERFPMNMIASYLGLSAETLSRIRKNGVRK